MRYKIIIIFFIFIITLSGCATPYSRWSVANRIGTKKAYQELLSDPDTLKNSWVRKNAIKCLAEIEFYETERIDTIEEYRNFIQKYPDSDYTPEAALEIDWRETQSIGTIDAYKGFIKRNPNSQYTLDLLKAIDDSGRITGTIPRLATSPLQSSAISPTELEIFDTSNTPNGEYQLYYVWGSNYTDHNQAMLWESSNKRRKPEKIILLTNWGTDQSPLYSGLVVKRIKDSQNLSIHSRKPFIVEVDIEKIFEMFEAEIIINDKVKYIDWLQYKLAASLTYAGYYMITQGTKVQNDKTPFNQQRLNPSLILEFKLIKFSVEDKERTIAKRNYPNPTPGQFVNALNSGSLDNLFGGTLQTEEYKEYTAEVEARLISYSGSIPIMVCDKFSNSSPSPSDAIVDALSGAISELRWKAERKPN